MIPLKPERKAQLEDYAERYGQDPANALDEAVAAYLESKKQHSDSAVVGDDPLEKERLNVWKHERERIRSIQFVKKEKDNYSGAISKQCRYLGLTILAIIWGLLTRNELGLSIQPYKAQLFVVSILAVAVLIFDFFQYVTAFAMWDRVDRDLRLRQRSDAKPKPNDWRNVASTGLFRSKIGLLVVTSIWFLFILVRVLFGWPSGPDF